MDCIIIIISRQALTREGDYKMHHVCVWGCVCACVSVRADFSKTTTATDLLLIVLMNFHALENFVCFVDLGLKVSE